MLRVALTIFLIVASSLICFAQAAEHPGVTLFRQGKFAEARASLAAAVKDKTNERNAELWNVLGLAYAKEGKFKEGRKALEKAVSLAPSVAGYHATLAYTSLMLRDSKKARAAADRALALNPKDDLSLFIRGTAFFQQNKLNEAEADAMEAIRLNESGAHAYRLESHVLMARLSNNLSKSTLAKELPLIGQAKDLLERGVAKCRGADCDDLKAEFEGLSAFFEYARKREADKMLTSADGPPTEPEMPGVTPLKILAKPRPGYTDEARSSNTQGIILLAVLFGVEGRVQHIVPLKRLGKGLDEQAMAAARKISFEPMKVNGQPAAVVKIVEYSFSIY